MFCVPGVRHVAAHPAHGLERLAADEECVELRHHPREVDVRIHDDPVVLAVGAGDEAVEGHGHVQPDRAGHPRFTS